MKRTKPKSLRVASQTPRPEPNYLQAEVMFDLDGTLAENTWPDTHIGQPIPEMIDLVFEYRAAGYAVSIFTSRPEDHRIDIDFWLSEQGLGNIVYRVICDKPAFALLIDDRSWNPWHTTPPSKTKS